MRLCKYQSCFAVHYRRNRPVTYSGRAINTTTMNERLLILIQSVLALIAAIICFIQTTRCQTPEIEAIYSVSDSLNSFALKLLAVSSIFFLSAEINCTRFLANIKTRRRC